MQAWCLSPCSKTTGAMTRRCSSVMRRWRSRPGPSRRRRTWAPGADVATAPDAAPKIRFFRAPPQWRNWLEKNHAKAAELWVGFYKRGSGKPSMTWPESVDEALCFGWIDAVRKSIDAERYKIRFTRRKPGSIWSAVNVRRVEALRTEGRMRP